MKKQLLIFLTVVLFSSCGPKNKEAQTIDKKPIKVEEVDFNSNLDTLTITKIKRNNKTDPTVIERFFPEKKEIVEFDTLISARNLKISIQSKFLDSYVTNKYENEGTKYIDKYRDSEKHLVIKQSTEIIIDTVFNKNVFAEHAGHDFLQIADFHGYWFNEIRNDTIELFGAIIKPETDWSFAFYHYLDLESRSFKVEEYIDEEI